MVSCLNIFLLNIRSLRHKLPELLLYLHELEKKYSLEFDVIALTETWVRGDESFAFLIEGYTLMLHERSCGRGGGVALYVKTGIPCSASPVRAVTFDGLNFDLGAADGFRLTGLLAYRPPSSNRSLFINELGEAISTLSSDSILLGDLNFDLLKPSTCANYSTTLASLGFNSHINLPTRVVSPSSSCIDHFYSRFKTRLGNFAVQKSQIEPNGLSDHHAIIVTLSCPVARAPPAPTNKKYSSKFTNWESLNAALLTENWNHLLQSNNVNDMFASFYSKLNTLLAENKDY